MSESKKQRIDQILVQKQLAPSRERAQSYIMAGIVFVNARAVQKPSETFPSDATIEIKGQDHPYVSRGGVKLEGALQDFHLDVSGFVCLDVGASTGGFTDCLLQKGAQKIYAVDVGYGQLDWKIRQDPRVIVREKTHVKEIRREDFAEPLDLGVVDVSFISLQKVIPFILEILDSSAHVLALIKPQFEADKGDLPRGGVLKNKAQREQIVTKTLAALKTLPVEIIGLYPSKLPGADGNQEYFVLLKKV